MAEFSNSDKDFLLSKRESIYFLVNTSFTEKLPTPDLEPYFTTSTKFN